MSRRAISHHPNLCSNFAVHEHIQVIIIAGRMQIQQEDINKSTTTTTTITELKLPIASRKGLGQATLSHTS
jgi:hypothetical protein